MGWDEEDDVYTCPVCGSEKCVPPHGKKDSQILIVGEFPGEEEISVGKPFVGSTGNVLRVELAKFGVDIKQARICNVWQHPPAKGVKNKKINEECLKHGMGIVIEEAKGKKAILLIGSDTVEVFCGKSVMAVTGLKVHSAYFSAPLIMACIQPTMVFRSTVGEVRLSLKKFANELEAIL